MAFTTGNDINILQSSDIAAVGAGAGNDRYVLDASVLTAGQAITISDADGSNTLQLTGGLIITSALVSSTALQLTLSNGAVVTVLGANNFSFQTGGNPINGAGGLIQNFSAFVTSSLNVAAGVPAAGAAPVAVGTVTVNANGGTGVVPTVPVVTSFTLTPGQDIQTANQFFASETYFNVDGKGPTIAAGDALTGTAGRTDNTLTVTNLTAGVATDNIPAGVQLTNIQNVVLNSSGNTAGGTGFSTVGYADVRNLTGITNGGQNDLFAAKNGVNGTAVTVTHNGFAGDTTIVGGTNVTASSVGGSIIVGSPGISRVPLSTEVATGAVVVNQRSSLATAGVNVFGGTTVNVTTSSASNGGSISIGNTTANTGNNVVGAIANALGAIVVNTAGTGPVTVFGGTDVNVTNTAISGAGQIIVGDVSRTVASNLATGNITVAETAAIAYNGLAGSTNNNLTSGAISVYGGKNVSVTTNAANDISIGNLGLAKENTLNPTGTITVVNTGISTAAAGATILVTGGTDVTVSNTGGSVTIGRSANVNSNIIDQVSNPTGNVSVTETLNGNGLGAKAVTIDGGANVTVAAKGQNVVIGAAVASAPTGAVLVNQSDFLTGNGAFLNGTAPGDVIVNGGTTVTVNTTGGSVNVGSVIGGVNTVASGAVAITRTFSGPNTDITSVQGGTTVAITSNKTSGTVTVGAASAALDATGAILKDAKLAPTGNVTIVDGTIAGATFAPGTGAVNVNTNGATTVSIRGGNVLTVNDIQSTLATGGANAGKAVGTSTLATVVLDNQFSIGAATAIASDVLASLSVLNAKAVDTITVTNNTAAHALTITQGGNSVTGATTTIIDAKAGAVTVTDNGTASTQVLSITAVKATSLTVNNAAAATLNVLNDAELTTVTLRGAGAVTLNNLDTLGKVATVDASTSTGAVRTGLTVTSTNGVAQKFTGGSGITSLTVTSNASTYGDGVLLVGGSGTVDVLVANYAATGTDIAMGNNASIKNFEILGLGALASSATGLYDAAGFSGVTLGLVAGNVSVVNAAKNASLSITAAPTNLVSFAGANTTGVADALTINVGVNPAVGAVAVAGFGAGTVTANGYENVTINSNGANAVPASVNTITLVDAASAGTGTLTVSGIGGITVLDTNTRFSAINVTNTKAVDVNGVTVSNTGAAITGGAGALKATGATGGTEVALVTFGTTGVAIPFLSGESTTVNVGGTSFAYTGGANASAATLSTAFAAAINANAATGTVTGQVTQTGAAIGVVAAASGGNLVLTKPVAIGAASVNVTFFTTSAAGTLAGGLVGGSEEQVITVVVPTAPVTAGATTINVTNGLTVSVTLVATDTPATIATKIATAINGTAVAANTLDVRDGLASAVAVGSTVVLTGGTANTGVFAAAPVTALTNGVQTTVGNATINYATANDSFTSGSGGGAYTVGLGGSWNATTSRYSSGSEAVNLSASAAKVDTIIAADGYVVTNNGTNGGVTGFAVANLAFTDVLTFGAGKTALTNVTVSASVSAVTGAATMAAVLDPSGALLTALGNLTYIVTNGVITFSATGGNSLSQFSTAQLISAAEILVNSSSTGGINKVAAFSTGGNSIVVASDAAATLALGVLPKDVLVQLLGVGSTTGFGTTGAQGTIGSTNVTNVTSTAVNTGSAAAAVYNDAGFSLDTITNAKFGTVSTTISNLAPSAILNLTGTVGATYEAVNVSQTGTAGLNSLTLNLSASTFKSISTTGDGLLVLNGGALINSLVDSGATNTLTTIRVTGQAPAILSVTDTVLTTVDTTGSTGGVAIFGATATPITNDGVTFTLSAGQNSTVFASGAADIFNQAAGAGLVQLTASGAANKISILSTNVGNVITATGAGDTISVGTGGFNITATGATNTINIASGAGSTFTTVGSGAILNIGTLNVVNSGTDTVVVTNAVTGATNALTTINSIVSPIFTTRIDFSGSSTGFSLLGGGTAFNASQVNVATATSLTDALNLAANITTLTLTQGSAASLANLTANTAKIDWFQYGGDTYVVAAVNNTGIAVAQTGLDANDIVVKLTGLVDLNGSVFTGSVLAI